MVNGLRQFFNLRKTTQKIAIVLLLMLALALSLPTHGFAKETSSAKVHFIDVGQGDSILIETPSGQAILVDGGTASAGQKVISYIQAQGITELYGVVATHPHEDHIGGLVHVIKVFPVQNFFMPNKEHTTATFANLVDAVNKSGAKRIQAKSGVTFEIDGVSFEFLSPIKFDYRNLNDYSAVIKVTHGKNRFLLTGDAEKESELYMRLEGHNLRADVLKVGHHGSNTSTSGDFVGMVLPRYSVISVGKDNSYGHPHEHVLNLLEIIKSDVYRTDELGTIVAISDGETLAFAFEKTPVISKAKSEEKAVETQEVTVYITRTGSKYHRAGCRYLRQSMIPIKLSDAKKRYGACSVCRPPM